MVIHTFNPSTLEVEIRKTRGSRAASAVEVVWDQSEVHVPPPMSKATNTNIGLPPAEPLTLLPKKTNMCAVHHQVPGRLPTMGLQAPIQKLWAHAQNCCSAPLPALYSLFTMPRGLQPTAVFYW